MSKELPSIDNVRALFFYVLKTRARCRACGCDTCVLAIALPEGHEVADEAEADDQSEMEWSRVGAVALLSSVAKIPDSVSAELQVFCPGYRLTRGEPDTEVHWANHCSRCDAPLDEEALHSEPDVAFVPFTQARAAPIDVLRIDQPFIACVRGLALDPPFFHAMRRV